MNISQALDYGVTELTVSESPEVDCQVLLCHVLECSSTYLHAWSDKDLTREQKQQFEGLIVARKQGQPVAHLTGSRGFWSLDLKVTKDTLIPRPDTELLVELALSKITAGMQVADLGTGSGAIVLSLATEHPNANFFAMDFSAPALQVANENTETNKLSNVKFWQGSWLEAIAVDSFDVIVSNPPYIERDDPHLSQGDVRFEPITALASGADGLDDIRIIIQQSQACLKASGWLMIEHGYHQGQQVCKLFESAGFTNVSLEQDFGGNDRVVIGQLPVS